MSASAGGHSFTHTVSLEVIRLLGPPMGSVGPLLLLRSVTWGIVGREETSLEVRHKTWAEQEKGMGPQEAQAAMVGADGKGKGDDREKASLQPRALSICLKSLGGFPFIM